MSIRTDMAQELRENLTELPPGIEAEELEFQNIRITRIRVRSKEGARALGKPIGRYVTIDTDAPVAKLLPKERRRLAKIAARELGELIGGCRGQILVVGLGNRMATADSVGPKVCDRVFVTRHILRHIPEAIDGRAGNICAIAPGVLGVTGLESLEVVRGIVREVCPSLVIAVDSLAARSLRRLGASIQLTDSGILPGSGLDNKREGLTQRSLEIPVIAIGIPTVAYTGTIVSDVLDCAMRRDDPMLRKKILGDVNGAAGSELVVAPKDIDVLTDYAAQLIAEMLDLALNPHLSREEIADYMS